MALTKKQKQMIRTWLKSKYSDEPHPNPLRDLRRAEVARERLSDIAGEYTDLYEKVGDVRDSETFHQDFEDELEAWRDEQFDEIKTKIRSGDKYPIHTTVGQKRVGFKRLM
tara:strand:+ start:193 stop:525 length:333 start_codon:yes stop_codon:yes gene_type:complete